MSDQTIDLGQSANPEPASESAESPVEGKTYPSVYLPPGVDLSGLPNEGTATIRYKKVVEPADGDDGDTSGAPPDTGSELTGGDSGTELQIMSITPESTDESKSPTDLSADAIEAGLASAEGAQ